MEQLELFPLTLNEYQERAGETDQGTRLFTAARVYDGYAYRLVVDDEIVGLYNAMGLNGEAGEVAEKIKKNARDGVVDWNAHRAAVCKEMGDVLWYLSRLAANFGYSLEDVARANLKKLADRREAGTLSGSGDNR